MAAPQRQLQPAAQDDGLLKLTAMQLCLVERRRSIVVAWRNLCAEFRAAGKTAAEATRLFLDSQPGLCKATLYNWAKARAGGDPLALLDRRSTCVRVQPGTVNDEAWQMFKGLWLTRQRRTVALCHLVVKDAARKNGWLWPTLRTIQRKVERELPPVQADYYRYGSREWSRRWGPKIRRDYSQYRANQTWVGDFHLLDVFCRKSQADWTIVRPLLCAWLDMRSRIIPGFRIVEREDQNAILLTFRDGVTKWGAPDEVVIDNGKPYRAYGVSGGRPTRKRIIEDEDYMQSVFGQLDVRVHFTIPYNPDSKPIERWFRTLEDQFCATFESYCGGDNKDPRWKAAEELARKHPEQCPTVAEFSELLGKYMEAYHATPHSGDGMDGLSPAQAFDRFDPIAKKTAPDGVLDLLMMRPTRPVKVTRYGVRYRGIEYGQNDPRLFMLQDKEVLLRVDPQDASYVIVCDPDGKPICRATNNSLALCGVTQDDLAEGMKAKARASRLAREVRDGGTQAALQTVSEASITASLKRRKPREPLEATGTDGPGPRNVRPVRAWLREQYDKSKTGPPGPESSERPFSFADLGEPESAGDDLRPIDFALLERAAAIDDEPLQDEPTLGEILEELEGPGDDAPDLQVPERIRSWDDPGLATKSAPEARPATAVAALHQWRKRQVEQ